MCLLLNDDDTNVSFLFVCLWCLPHFCFCSIFPKSNMTKSSPKFDISWDSLSGCGLLQLFLSLFFNCCSLKGDQKLPENLSSHFFASVTSLCKCGNKISNARTDGLVNQLDIDSKHFIVFQIITLSNSVFALLLLSIFMITQRSLFEPFCVSFAKHNILCVSLGETGCIYCLQSFRVILSSNSYFLLSYILIPEVGASCLLCSAFCIKHFSRAVSVQLVSDTSSQIFCLFTSFLLENSSGSVSSLC